MKTKLLKFSLLLLLVVSCSKDDSEQNQITIDPAQKEPLSTTQVNAEIDNTINTKGTFNWKDASSHLVWSATVHGNNIVSIGFGNSKNDFDRSKSTNSTAIQNELLQIIQQYEGVSLDKILIASDQYLNIINVIIKKQETIIAD